MSYLNYFGFTCIPFHKTNPHIWAHEEINDLEDNCTFDVLGHYSIEKNNSATKYISPF